MAIYKFLPQMISAIPGRLTLFQAMLVDSNGASVTGKTFSAGDVKVLKYDSPNWDVSNIDTLPTEIGSTGVYLFELSSDETSPTTDSFPVGVKVEQSNGDQIYGFFSVNINPANADARYLNGLALDGNNATLNLHQLVIDSYVPPNGSPGYYDDAVVIKGKTAILVEGNDADPAIKIINNDEGAACLMQGGDGAGGTALHLKAGDDNVSSNCGLLCEGDGVDGGYGIRVNNGIYSMGANDVGFEVSHKGEALTLAGYDTAALGAYQGGDPSETDGTIRVIATDGAPSLVMRGGVGKPGVDIKGGMPDDPDNDGPPAIKIGPNMVGLYNAPGVEIDSSGNLPGLTINNQTIPELVSEAVVDGPTKLAEAISEILAYASCATERDPETGIITYKNRNGDIIFTLTPGINGRTRGPEIQNIMNHVMNHHFNNPS